MSKSLRVLQRELKQGRLQLSADAAHYVLRVHRLRPGAGLVLFDPWQGSEADAELLSTGQSAQVQAGAPRPAARLGLSCLQLVQGVGKGDKLDRVVRDAVALGVGSLWVVQNERSVRLLDAEPSAAAEREPQARWENIALDTLRQCERGDLPRLRGPSSVADVVQQTPGALRCLLHPQAGAPPLLELLTQQLVVPLAAPSPSAQISAAQSPARQAPAVQLPATIQLWVGPEGGFSDAELELLQAAGALRANLGPLILRTELAASAAVAVATAVLWPLYRP